MTLAKPAISSTVSPFMRSAVMKAATWAGVASPIIISSIADAACSNVSERPLTTVSMASLITGLLLALENLSSLHSSLFKAKPHA
jgi:hypothetical protein